MDVTSIVGAINSVAPDLEAIGAAVIGLAVIALTVKWVKGMVLS